MLKSANFEYLLDARLKKVYFSELSEVPTILPQLYNIQTSDKAVEYDYGFGDIGAIGSFSNKIDYQDITGQYRTTYEHVEYAGGIQIAKKLIDDDQYNVIMKAPGMLAVAMRRRRETDGAAVLNNAFSAGVTYGDSLSLCNSSHTAAGTTTTWSNTGTTALSTAALSATRLLMKKFTSSSDQIVDMDPDMIIVPIDLQETAEIILKTDKKVDSANNDINFSQGRYKMLVARYLTDTNNWFMVDSTLMKKYMNWYNRKPVEFNSDVDMDTRVKKYSSYMRYSCGASEWRFIYGHAV